MVQCTIEGCKSRSDLHSVLKDGVHFHRVPKNPELRSKWSHAIKKEVNQSTRICSKHFQLKNYYTTPNGRKKLLLSAVPDLNLVTGDEDNSNSTSKIQKVHSPKFNPNISRNSRMPDSNEHQRMPQIRVLLDPNEVRQRIGERDQLTTIKNEKDIKTEFQIDTGMETDPFKINAENKERTLLERRLIKEVKKLRVLSKKRLEAINCLEEQNQRLLQINNYLQQKLNNYCKRGLEDE